MKTICFLIGNMDNSGGTERVTSLIASELSSQGYNVSILSLVSGLKPYFRLAKGIKLSSITPKKTSFKKQFIKTVLGIRKFIKVNDIDTLIVVDSISCLFTIPALYGMNTNHICWEHFNFHNNNGVRLRDIARRLACRYCNYVVTLTNYDKSLWENGIDNITALIITIPNPSPYSNVVSDYPKLSSKTVLSVGRLTPVKGFDLLIKAWSEVCKLKPDWELHIVGSGICEDQLKEQVNNLGIINQVKFIPATKNIEQHYSSSSLYCLSSRNEGFPMVLLEAQAYGLPIVAFNCETGPSDIITDGDNGYLVPHKNIDKMKESLTRLMNLDIDSYNQMVKNSLDNSKNYDIKVIIEQWKKIL